MLTDTQLLTLAQWLSPAFPVGAFAYSHGLEALVHGGHVENAEDLESWLEQTLRFGAARSDALFLAAAFHAEDAADLAKIDATARAFAASRERLLESDQQGRAFGKITGDIWAADLSGLVLPVALGRAAALENIPVKPVIQMYLHAFVSNLTSAGQRLLPVGQTKGQAIVKNLTPLCIAVAEETSAGDLDSLGSTAFLGDVASMRHETQYSRIFRT